MFEDIYIKIITVIFLFVSGVLLRQTLIYAKQNWLNNFTHLLTFTILPTITFVVTSVISGNIALSLGMVGALSIVRFRNPVKSPLELTFYFCLITLGISASVSLLWSIFLIITIESIVVSILIFNYVSENYFNKSIFKPSFIEGNQLSTLEFTFNKSEDMSLYLENNLLINHSFEDNEFTLRFASANKKDIIDLIELNKANKNLKNYRCDLI